MPKSADMHFWAVNACDQFTSDLSYWQSLEKSIGERESALKLVFPEIYLKDNPASRIANINDTMRSYLISEATILERIPPRVEIRKGAPLELPHIMLLYDDKSNSVLNAVRRGEVLYDFELNMGGGHIKGTFVENSAETAEKFYSLSKGENPLLFAVGDGNHSLATAKTCWEQLKKTLTDEQKKNHPARFALCEAVNIYDKALFFEPIHRLIKTDKPGEFPRGLITEGNSSAYLVVNGKSEKIPFDGDIPAGIRKLDRYIEDFISEKGGEVDYIHGADELIGFTKGGGAGVILPAIKKDDFFRPYGKGGNLPRKTFSMGEGNEKRYYIEAKLIK